MQGERDARRRNRRRGELNGTATHIAISILVGVSCHAVTDAVEELEHDRFGEYASCRQRRTRNSSRWLWRIVRRTAGH